MCAATIVANPMLVHTRLQLAGVPRVCYIFSALLKTGRTLNYQPKTTVLTKKYCHYYYRLPVDCIAQCEHKLVVTVHFRLRTSEYLEPLHLAYCQVQICARTLSNRERETRRETRTRKRRETRTRPIRKFWNL